VDAVIYTRVSRDHAEGRSVADQESECRSFCNVKGWPIRKVFCDNSIGASRHSVKERPQWKLLQKDLRSGDVLVVWESSRAGRDLEEFVELRRLCADLGVPLSYGGRVLDLTLGDDRFTGGLDALIAEREAEQIRTRVLRGKRSSAADGRPMTKPPWGYVATTEIDAMGRKRPQWVPDPVEAPRVREAVERILSGQSQRQVLAWLQSTGRAPTTPTTLRRSLTNPALAAKRVHQGEVFGDASWAALITEEQHQQLLDRVKRMPNSPGREPKWLLSGIATCGKCGQALRHKSYKNRKDGYVCPSGCVSRIADDLDAVVVNRLFDRLESVDPAQYESDDATDILGQIKTLEAELEEWTAKAIASEVSPTAFAKIEKGLQVRIDALRDSIPPPMQSVSVEALREGWDTLSIAERRNAIRVFLRVTVPPLGRVRALPGDVLVEPL
jgi:DNA invertase Pin-like site-specific DNA recombinase